MTIPAQVAIHGITKIPTAVCRHGTRLNKEDSMEIKDTLQAIKNTLETLMIQSTEDNMTKLLACRQLLTQMIEGMNEDGNADTE